jgi:hypothetical protein
MRAFSRVGKKVYHMIHMCHAWAVEKNGPEVVVIFPRPHLNGSRKDDFFQTLDDYLCKIKRKSSNVPTMA